MAAKSIRIIQRTLFGRRLHPRTRRNSIKSNPFRGKLGQLVAYPIDISRNHRGLRSVTYAVSVASLPLNHWSLNSNEAECSK